MTTKKQEKAAKAVKTEPVKIKTDSVKKEAAPKTRARKATAKKEMKVQTIIEYYDKKVEEKDIVAAVKKAWTRSGKRVGDIKTMELYIKPQDGAVYYVINGKATGAVAF